MKKWVREKAFCKIGVPSRSRTCNLRLRRASRYPIVPWGLGARILSADWVKLNEFNLIAAKNPALPRD